MLARAAEIVDDLKFAREAARGTVEAFHAKFFAASAAASGVSAASFACGFYAAPLKWGGLLVLGAAAVAQAKFFLLGEVLDAPWAASRNAQLGHLALVVAGVVCALFTKPPDPRRRPRSKKGGPCASLLGTAENEHIL